MPRSVSGLKGSIHWLQMISAEVAQVCNAPFVLLKIDGRLSGDVSHKAC